MRKLHDLGENIMRLHGDHLYVVHLVAQQDEYYAKAVKYIKQFLQKQNRSSSTVLVRMAFYRIFAHSM